MASKGLISDGNRMPVFEKILHTMKNYEDLEDEDQMRYYMTYMLMLAMLWDPSDKRFANVFIELFPSSMFKDLLRSPKYERNMDVAPEFREYINVDEYTYSPSEIAFLLLSCVCTCSDLHGYVDSLDLLDEIIKFFCEYTESDYRDGIVMYLERVCESGRHELKFLNQKLLRCLAHFAVRGNKKNLDARGFVSHLLIQIENLAIKYRNVYDTSPRDAPLNPEQLLCILEPMTGYLVNVFSDVLDNIHTIFELMPALVTLDRIGRNTPKLCKEIAPVYLHKIRHGLKILYTSNVKADEHHDFYERMNLYNNFSRTVSGLTLMLAAVSLIGSWVGEDWLMTEVNIKYTKFPVDMSNAQFTAIVVSSAAIEIEIYLTSVCNDSTYNLETYQAKEQELLILVDIVKKALDYLNGYCAKHEEDMVRETRKGVLAHESSTKVPLHLVAHMLNKLRQLNTSIRSFLIDILLNADACYTKVGYPFVKELISYTCKWTIYHVDECKDYLSELCRLIFTIFEKSDISSQETPIRDYLWFLIDLVNRPELLKSLVEEDDLFNKVLNIWINQPLPMSDKMDYIMAMVPYKLLSELDNIVFNLSRDQHTKLLDRLAFMIKHTTSLDASECRTHYKGILSFIAACDISYTCVHSEHIDLFIDSYISVLTEELVKTDPILITKAPRVIMEVSNIREPPSNFSKYENYLHKLEMMKRDNLELINKSGCSHYLDDIIKKIREGSAPPSELRSIKLC